MTLFKNTKKKIKYGLKKAAINIKHFLKLPTNKNDINILRQKNHLLLELKSTIILLEKRI